MQFDGMNFKESRTVVALPADYWTGTNKAFVTFGKVCKPNIKGAILTNYVRGEKKEPVYAKQITTTGHSLTNLAFGEKKMEKVGVFNKFYLHMYLLRSGKVYTHKKYL